MATPAVETVLGFADAINRGDREAAVAYCDPEIEFLSVLAVSGRRYVGHDGIRESFDDVSQAWAEWRVEMHRAAAAPTAGSPSS